MKALPHGPPPEKSETGFQDLKPNMALVFPMFRPSHFICPFSLMRKVIFSLFNIFWKMLKTLSRRDNFDLLVGEFQDNILLSVYLIKAQNC